jgi:hypothetical protein
MIIGLCWIIGSYAACILMVHLMRRIPLWQPKGKAPVHYLLLTRNNQTQIEWYLRYLVFIAWWEGRPLKVTLADDGSTDDTLAIAGRLRESLSITVLDDASSPEELFRRYMNECTVVMNLRNRNDLVEVPLF